MQTKQCRSAALKIASCVELNGEETADDDDDDDNGDKKTMKQNVNCSVSDLPSHWTRPHNSQVHTHTHTHMWTHAQLHFYVIIRLHCSCPCGRVVNALGRHVQ